MVIKMFIYFYIVIAGQCVPANFPSSVFAPGIYLPSKASSNCSLSGCGGDGLGSWASSYGSTCGEMCKTSNNYSGSAYPGNYVGGNNSGNYSGMNNLGNYGGGNNYPQGNYGMNNSGNNGAMNNAGNYYQSPTNTNPYPSFPPNNIPYPSQFNTPPSAGMSPYLLQYPSISRYVNPCDNTLERKQFENCVKNALNTLNSTVRNCRRTLGNDAPECCIEEECIKSILKNNNAYDKEKKNGTEDFLKYLKREIKKLGKKSGRKGGQKPVGEDMDYGGSGCERRCGRKSRNRCRPCGSRCRSACGQF